MPVLTAWVFPVTALLHFCRLPQCNLTWETTYEKILRTRKYLDYFGLDTGYMISFNFNQNKQTGVRKVAFDNKTLIEAMI